MLHSSTDGHFEQGDLESQCCPKTTPRRHPGTRPRLDATTMLRRFTVTIQILLSVRATLAAFTLPTSYLNNVVQKNSQQTWCYFPATGQTKVVSCDGADFGTVLQVHLNTTISIGYYAPDNTRLGGPEWPVPQQNGGKVTLCVSGRAEDGTYQSACMSVTTDNSLPMGTTNCIVVVAQPVVSDGCYVPEQLAAVPPSSSSTSQTTTPPPPSSLIHSTSSSSSVSQTTSGSSVTRTSSTTQVASPTVTSHLSGNQLTIGDIIGIITGVIAAIALGITIYECNKRRRPRREKEEENERQVRL